jgi:hypothetical protein
MTTCPPAEAHLASSAETTLFGKLRGAASLQPPAAASALDLLTGSWDRPAGLFARRARSPQRQGRSTHLGAGKKRTLYLDEQAENDLQFLLAELGRELGSVTRSEGVRRALRAARVATERQRTWES